MGSEGMDVVYTWVDDSWPGYLPALQAHAQRPLDTNPNRTRDNLDLLRYSLRSVWRYMPFVRDIVLVTARPQVPAWLHLGPRVRLVHHDEIFAPEHLPCFNSFAIVANLARIPGLSEQFLYMEDDRLLGAPLAPQDLHTHEHIPWLYAKWPSTDRPRHALPPNPWNAALAESNRLLDAHYGARRRLSIKHAPVLFDRGFWPEFEARYAPALERTRASRFRSPGNVAVEHLLPYDMLHRRRARTVSWHRAHRATAYWGLDNHLWLQRAGRNYLRWKRPQFLCLNDNYGPAPHPRCVATMRRYLADTWPWPSPFEVAP